MRQCECGAKEDVELRIIGSRGEIRVGYFCTACYLASPNAFEGDIKVSVLAIADLVGLIKRIDRRDDRWGERL